ncbi:MAG: DUF6273 domain-containing protein [Eubacteriales bacterium]
MAIFKCKICGGTLEIDGTQSVATCEYCGTKQTLPKLDDERKANLYDRANHFRRNNDFDKAMSIYEQILNEDNTDAESYWSILLCRYGIEYVEDPATHKRVPTVNRAQYTSIFDDEDYKSALQYADSYQREIYEAEASAINEIQKNILAISQKEEPFDVFICYKETDSNGRRTQDSVLATELYHELTREGFKVFFSRITLEDKLGQEYEPYIFAALNSAKVMVVLGTKPEHFNAVWVKNEWSRYLALIKSGAKKTLIPAYRDMDPYDLPEEFSHLQAQDMSKLGFMQDLTRGIKKIVEAGATQATVKETVITSAAAHNIAPLLKRAFMFLEDGEFDRADDFCEQVLNQDPENAEAYLGKLMVDLHVKKREELANCAEPFDDNKYFQKTVRFADTALATDLKGYVASIKDRNNRKAEEERKETLYLRAVDSYNYNSIASEEKALNIFTSLSGYKDSDNYILRCKEKIEQIQSKAEEERKEVLYLNAMDNYESYNVEWLQEAVKLFTSLTGYKDSDERARLCKEKIEQIQIKEEKDRIKSKKRKKAFRLIALAISIIIIIVIVAFIIFAKIILPNLQYSDAMTLMNQGKYEEAISVFEELEGYKDCKEKIEMCNAAITEQKYNDAIALMNEGKYEEAISVFEELNGYKDSNQRIEECTETILNLSYEKAIEFMNDQQYEKAIAIFKDISGYKDSNKKASDCEYAINDIKYNKALGLIETKKFDDAISILETISSYRDSTALITKAKNYKIKYASVGDIILLGSYEQDNNSSNGKEAIEWYVIGKEGNKLLLISKYALDAQSYSYKDINGNYYVERYGSTWETCDLRKWLNNEFYSSAFSSNESKIIASSLLINNVSPIDGTNAGPNTTDKVFVLSTNEFDKYIGNNESVAATRATEYAVSKGAYKNTTTSYYNKNTKYWLRTPGQTWDNEYSISAIFVGISGSYGSSSMANTNGVTNYMGVRPSIWIDVGSIN